MSAPMISWENVRCAILPISSLLAMLHTIPVLKKLPFSIGKLLLSMGVDTGNSLLWAKWAVIENLGFKREFMGVVMLEKLFNQGNLLELLLCYAQPSLLHAKTGWPQHREKREFGFYFFQTRKTQGICYNTGKFFETQGKYFWLYLLTQKAWHNFSFKNVVIWTISSNIFTVPIYLLYYVTFLEVSTKLIQVVLKTNWNNVIGNM